MLISSARHRLDDLPLWDSYAQADAAKAEHKSLSKRAFAAMESIKHYCRRGLKCYCGVSWGKDSVVVADLVCRATRLHNLSIPMIWIRVEPIKNPDCDRVRDAFLREHDCDYHEVVVDCRRDESGWHATGTLEEGFRQAAKIAGTRRHVSGIRGSESSNRKISVQTQGVATKTSCRPLAHWQSSDVFGWLARKNLPIHPAYAMLGGGRWDREWIRVASLGGRRGDGLGRAEWEAEYYGDVLRRLEAAAPSPPPA